MLSMDADIALRKDCDAEPDDSLLRSSREGIAENHPGHSGTELRSNRLALNNGIGWIEVLRPNGEIQANFDEPAAMTFQHDELAPARGIVFGIVFGASLWAMIVGLVTIALF